MAGFKNRMERRAKRARRAGRSRRERVFREVFTNVPKTVKKAASKRAQRKQKTAIALSKLRRDE